ncbi:hypothetical protein K239x_29740 [Planctomycetes bacterium K23_9]|uniref:Uncharacterized protein n=1 Tax=Stieleria marina TaxID=1930275 RepID=A0A517NV30_9BACT|nr:hypothetical protein K239x_29740 [Planctomycetes bacterium K23_9]
MWPFARISLLQYTMISVIAFGIWQIGLGGAIIYREMGAGSVVSASGANVSVFSFLSGILAMISGALLVTRKPVARYFAIWCLTSHTLMFLYGAIPTNPGGELALEVRIGAAPLWLMPGLLVILLMSRAVTEEFTRDSPEKAEP